MSVTNDNRRPSIPHPQGGFQSDEEEARWLEQTLVMRTQEALDMVGARVTVPDHPKGMYDLLLLALQSAGRRALGRKP